MCSTCFYAEIMGKHIQIREVDEEMRRLIKQRASEAGLSLSAYLKRLIAQDLSKPSWAEFTRKLSELPPVPLNPDSATIIREEREARAAHLESLTLDRS